MRDRQHILVQSFTILLFYYFITVKWRSMLWYEMDKIALQIRRQSRTIRHHFKLPLGDVPFRFSLTIGTLFHVSCFRFSFF